jgi:hypothetical protein
LRCLLSVACLDVVWTVPVCTLVVDVSQKSENPFYDDLALRHFCVIRRHSVQKKKREREKRKHIKLQPSLLQLLKWKYVLTTTTFFPFSGEISRFSVKKAIACRYLKKNLKRANCISVLYPVRLRLLIG